MKIDKKKTINFYKDYSDVCDCDHCKNYIYYVSDKYPKIKKYLETLGIDIKKPFELMPLDYDDLIMYFECQYIVFGKCEKDFYKKIDDIEIFKTDNHPYTNIKDEHFVISFGTIALEDYMKEEIIKNKKQLEDWLSDSHELGRKPYKINYTNSFEDEDGIRCFIYKYKKHFFSKWCLGIVSDSGTFSEMLEYKRETEIEDAKKILESLKNYWKEQAKNISKR